MDNDTQNNTSDNSSIVYNDGLNLKSPDLVDKIIKRIEGDEPAIKRMVEQSKTNESYYFATYQDEKKLRTGEINIATPKLFENLETIIPIVTRKSPEPEFKIFPRTQKNRRLERLCEYFCKDQWQTSEDLDGQEMQPKLEENTRNLFNQKITIWKYYYDPIRKRICTTPVPLDKIIFNVKARSVDELPYIAERVGDTYGNLCKKFPKMKDKLKEAIGKDNLSEDSWIEHIQYWEDKFVAWIYINKDNTNRVMLGAERNPNYNYPVKTVLPDGQEVTEQSFNHFPNPKKPYIMDTDLRLNQGMFGKSSLVEINIPLVKAIDKRKRQIDKNANLANGQVVAAGDRISEENLAKIDFQGNTAIRLEGTDNVNGAFDILTGRAIDSAVVDDMMHSEGHIDSTTGAYGTVRGEREAQETAAGREILKESSYGRSEPLFRKNERDAQKLFNAWIQLMCVFGDEEYVVTSASADSSSLECLSKEQFKKDDIKKIICIVKDGSTIPVDKASRMAQAADDYKAGALSTVDYLRFMEYEDPEGLAKRAYQQQAAPQELYNTNGDEMQFNIEAIRHVAAIIQGEINGSDPLFAYDVTDIESYQAHMKTHTDYLLGKEIDEDIPSFTSLDESTQSQIQAHMRIELEILQTMVQEQKTQATLEGLPPEPMQEELPPTPPPSAQQQIMGGGQQAPQTQPMPEEAEQPAVDPMAMPM